MPPPLPATGLLSHTVASSDVRAGLDPHETLAPQNDRYGDVQVDIVGPIPVNHLGQGNVVNGYFPRRR
jgi:hypothetical protein